MCSLIKMPIVVMEYAVQPHIGILSNLSLRLSVWRSCKLCNVANRFINTVYQICSQQLQHSRCRCSTPCLISAQLFKSSQTPSADHRFETQCRFDPQMLLYLQKSEFLHYTEADTRPNNVSFSFMFCSTFFFLLPCMENVSDAPRWWGENASLSTAQCVAENTSAYGV